MNLNEETECIEIISDIICREDHREQATFNDWLLAEKILDEVVY